MNCLFLSGNSIQNKDWIERVDESFSDIFEKTHIQYYDHWEKGEKVIDIATEQNKLLKYSPNLGEEYVVFAKSIGTYLAAKCIKEKIIKPKKCVFVGVPVEWAHEKKFSIDWAFDKFNINSLFIHNTDDPITSAEVARKFIEDSGVKEYKFKELDGNDHVYSEIETIKAIVKNFVYQK